MLPGKPGGFHGASIAPGEVDMESSNRVALISRRLVVAIGCSLPFSILLLVAKAEAAHHFRVQESLAPLIEKARDAVVLVLAKEPSGKTITQGSGFLIDSSGILVTNLHVIRGATEVIAKFANGMYATAEGILGVDDQADVAVLRLSATGLPALRVGDSKAVKVGDRVIAIGSPLALEGTVSHGILSAIREIGKHFAFQVIGPLFFASSMHALLNPPHKPIAVTILIILVGHAISFRPHLIQIIETSCKPQAYAIPVVKTYG